MNETQLKPFGLGIVAEAKAAGNKFITVHLSDAFPLHEGEIKSTHEKLEIVNKNALGEEYKDTLQRNTCVTAEWFGGDNRFTSPCVQKGEQVKLFHIPGTDRFYWDSVGRDNNLRRTETIVGGIAASGEKPGNAIELTNKNSYVYGIDSTTGIIYLNTSKNNGEKAAYKLYLNTKDGNWSVEDDLGNHVQMDSTKPHFLIELSDGTSIEARNKEVVIEADTIRHKCKQFIVDANTTTINSTVINNGAMTVTQSITSPKVDTQVLSGVPIGNYKKN